MEMVADGLFRSIIEKPFNNAVTTAAYFLVRPEGNILFYSSAFIEQHFDFMEKQGGVAHQLVNHRDEASGFCDLVAAKFQAPLQCHALEKDAILSKCSIGKTFESRHHLFPDLEAIPTPGHCPGSTCFLYEGKTNILFTGDTFYPAKGTWSVAVADGKQEQMIESLTLLRDLKVDMVLPSLFIGDIGYQSFASAEEFYEVIDQCISRLKNGGVH